MRSTPFTLGLAAAALAMTVGTAPAFADVKAGVEAWQKGDYQQAVAEWRPLAIAGDPDAQFNLGQAYKLGRGVPTDLGQAENWYRRAAEQGHLQAEDNLGLVLFTANRREQAMPYITRSALRGEPRAQYVLGTAHFNGDLAPRDWPLAYALTKRASDAGLSIASARLSQLDRLISLEERQAGLAMLPEMERNEQRARLAAATAATPPALKAPTPKPQTAVRPTALPPSVPGTSYVPPPVIASTSPIPPAPRPIRPAVSVPAPIPTADLPPSEPGTSYAPPPNFDPAIPAASDQPVPDLPPVEVVPAPPPVVVAPAPAPAVRTPAPKPAPAAPAAARSGWRAQLGAFSTEARARALWTGLERKYPAFAARQPYLVKAGTITRLQAGDFASQAEAEAFCAKVRPGGQACVVLKK